MRVRIVVQPIVGRPLSDLLAIGTTHVVEHSIFSRYSPEEWPSRPLPGNLVQASLGPQIRKVVVRCGGFEVQLLPAEYVEINEAAAVASVGVGPAAKHDDERARVSSRIAEAIISFLESHARFHANELKAHVEAECGEGAPASADRILRDLRQRGLVNYRVVSKRDSLYEVLPCQTRS